MTHQAPTAVIVVDFSGGNGKCSNCGEAAVIDTAHSCGARVIGVAFDALLHATPTYARAMAIADKCPPGVTMLGVGEIVSGPYGTGFQLVRPLRDLN